jgi:hypothetical protein
MATYVGKVTRADHESLPKKFLTAWINGSQKMEPPNYYATITLQMLFTKSSHQKPSQTEMHHSENGLHWLKKRVSGTPILTDTSSHATNLIPPKMTQKETA